MHAGKPTQRGRRGRWLHRSCRLLTQVREGRGAGVSSCELAQKATQPLKSRLDIVLRSLFSSRPTLTTTAGPTTPCVQHLPASACCGHISTMPRQATSPLPAPCQRRPHVHPHPPPPRASHCSKRTPSSSPPATLPTGPCPPHSTPLLSNHPQLYRAADTHRAPTPAQAAHPHPWEHTAALLPGLCTNASFSASRSRPQTS